MTKVKSFLFSMVVNLIIIFSFIFCFTNLIMSVEPDEILENVMKRVDEVMLTTSPLLYEYGLVYRGGVLLPDKAALMRGDE